MDMADELDSTIRENAAGPESASADGGQVKQYNLRDQVEAQGPPARGAGAPRPAEGPRSFSEADRYSMIGALSTRKPKGQVDTTHPPNGEGRSS